MASRKHLKRHINGIISELFAESICLRSQADEKDRAVIDTLLEKLIRLQNEHICRISHTEPGNVKGFYRKLYQDFNAGIGEIIEGLNKIIAK